MASSTVQEFLGHLEKVKTCGDEWEAVCPAHDDGEPSLGVNEGADGRVLLTCRAGCPTEDVVAALGLDMSDLFPSENGTPRRRGWTLADYAETKGVPSRFLRSEFDVRTKREPGRSPAVAIPYRDAAGETIRTRFRTADRFWWGKGSGVALYGLHRLADADPDRAVLLVEGESDVHTLSFHGILAVGVPGASSWRSSWTRHLEGRDVYVWREPDQGGDKLVADVADDLTRARVIEAPDDAKDPSDLHLHDRDGFRGRLTELTRAARPIRQVSANSAKVGSSPSDSSGPADGKGSWGSANSANVEWGEPIPLGPDTPEPYPVEALPDWLAQYVLSVATATQTPTDLPLMVGLAALSVATANKVRVVVKAGYDVPAHLWTATVLPPASRKSPVFRHVTRPIFEYEEELTKRTAPERQRAADERDVVDKALADAKNEAAKAAGSEGAGEARQKVHELRERLEGVEVPGEPRLVASDITSEKLARLMADNHGRVAVLAPEGDLFRIMAGRYSGGVSFDHYKRAWTGDEPIRDDRVGRDGSHVRRPALTMGLCLQPSVLDTLEEKDSFRGEGLLGRFLYAVPDSGIGRRRTGSSVPELNMDAARRYRDNLRRLLDAPPKDLADDGEYVPHEMTLSPDARELWDGFAAEVETMLGPGGCMEHIPDWGGKLVGQVFRLAAILQAAHRVGEGADPWGSELSGRAMRSAVKIGRAAISHALQVFDALEADPDLRLARYLLRRLRGLTADQDDPPTQRDLFERVKGKVGLGTVEELERVLEILEAHHLVRVVHRDTSGPGQPPSPWVRLNPDATSNIRRIRRISRLAPLRGGSANSANVERGDDSQSGDPVETDAPEAREPESVEVEL